VRESRDNTASNKLRRPHLNRNMSHRIFSVLVSEICGRRPSETVLQPHRVTGLSGIPYVLQHASSVGIIHSLEYSVCRFTIRAELRLPVRLLELRGAQTTHPFSDPLQAR
jgi:hypothetical protein